MLNFLLIPVRVGLSVASALTNRHRAVMFDDD